MSYNKTNWKKGDTISSAGLNNLENGVYNAHTDISNMSGNISSIFSDIADIYEYIIPDLVIQSSVDVDLNNPSVSDFTIVEGNILGLEDKIDNGEIVNGVCILRQHWNWLSNKNKYIYILPLTEFYVPYHEFGFGGLYLDTPHNNGLIQLKSVRFNYSEETGNLTQVYVSTKSIQ